MWGGLDFFVSIETLVSFAIPPSLCHGGATSATSEPGDKACAVKRAGNPTVRRLHFTRERRLTPVFAFPNATLFLQVLFSSGNKVHLMTPWDKEDTTTILKSFGWVSFLADARRVSVVPGSSQFSFSSLGIDPADYTRTVLVVEHASRWSSATTMQLIEVRHMSEGQDVADSMELLYALSRCILFSEWYLRYPSSSIASCAALSNTTVFAFCRFLLDGAAPDADLMRLVCYHGGRIVHTAAEATHILALPPPPAERGAPSSTSSSTASSSTSSSGDDSGSESDEPDCRVHSTSTDTSDEGREDSTYVPHEKSGERPVGDSDARRTSFVAPAVATEGTASLSAPGPSATTPQRPAAGPSSETHAAVAQSLSVASSAATNASLQPAIVTPSWVHRCIRALRLVPIDCAPATTAPSAGEEEGQGQGGPHGGGKAEAAHTTGALLSALLPPADARPLLWTTLHSIASQHGYDTAALVQHTTTASPFKTVTAACVLEALTSPVYSDVVEVRLQPPPIAGKTTDSSSTSSRSRGVPVTRRTLDSLKLSTASSELGRIALHRFERRRDKEAVFAHLQLIASQFLYSFDYVQRQRSQSLHCHGGTQTSGVRRAFMGTMTEAQQPPASRLLPANEQETAGARETAAAVTGDVPLKERDSASSSAMTAAAKAVEPITSDAAGAVDEKEWRHHLRNVEGKLLMSHAHVSEMSANQTKHFRDGGPRSRGVGDAEVCAKAVRAPATQYIEHVEKAGLPTVMMEEAFTLAPPYSPKIVAETSRDELLPARPPPAPSLLKPPSSLLPLPPMAKSIVNGRGGADASFAEFTACFIPTSVLTADQQCDFYSFLCSLPLFDSAELGNSVVRVADGVRCRFANHKGAKDFLRIEFIEFLSLHLPIYPALDDSIDVEDLHKTIMDFPLLPLPTAPEVSHEEAQSLWTAPAPPEATACASPPAVRPHTSYSSETGLRPPRHSPRPPSAHPRSPTNLGSDLTPASHAGPHASRCDLRAESRWKRQRDDNIAEESPLPDDRHRSRDRYRGDRHRSSSSRHVESSSSSHRRHYGDDRGDRHRLLRDDSDRGSRSSGHHRQHSRRGRR
ncbi:conserved hypothetical protein [Leishmania mexicana MHOM/GT/2001/U1103]|uniref:Uncharacterized protein n=1 Tax=Leishmania mexicana (strain MHOM/GT/2001/U1103) TaxID=929439 RepID=E9AXA8_LEIMU|nr:conserved hypothetical protein [Leishmania mexicana MHOM/GT/2001/U1103]CBZ27599.1 conserved hypothetical protein [Leishmania mexicana MHOM/GT/2001/U1103]